MPSRVQLINGNFQDAEGNLLSNGYLIMRLSQDGNVTGVGQITAGIDVKILLDANGNVQVSPAQLVWGNDQMTPVNSFYRVFGYKFNGQLAWGPNNQQVIGSGGTFDLNTWVPNQIISWVPPITTPLLQTNSVNNASQTVENLIQGSGVTLTNNGSGTTISATNQTGPLPSIVNWHYWASYTNTAFTQGVGVQLGSGGVISVIDPTATEPHYTAQTTAGGAGSNCSVNETVPGHELTLGVFNRFLTRVIHPSTANVRVWIGFANAISGFSADTPAGNSFVGFRYSTNAGDVNWQAVVNNAGAQTLVNSAVAVTTSGFVLGCSKNASNDLVFTINGNTVGTILHTDPNLPTNTTFLQPMIWIDNVGLANAKTQGVSYLYWDTIP